MINRHFVCVLIALCAIGAAPAAAGSLGGPLELQDEGSFFIGGRSVRSEHPGTPNTGGAGPGQIMINQMYVQYRIPRTVSGPPIVMVHGSGHTGVTYETTPDGREGWATYFVRKNFPVYVVDHSGRGRSGFDPTPINRAREQSDPKGLPNIPLTTRERAWTSFKLGLSSASHGISTHCPPLSKRKPCNAHCSFPSKTRPKESFADRCGQRSDKTAGRPPSSRQTTKFSPKHWMPTGFS